MSRVVMGVHRGRDSGLVEETGSSVEVELCKDGRREVVVVVGKVDEGSSGIWDPGGCHRSVFGTGTYL